MTTNQGYTDKRMNLQEVCSWLQVRNWGDLSIALQEKFSSHTWTKDGMIRVDVLEDIFERVFGTTLMFRELECDVITALSFIPDFEAHVD